MPRLLVQGMLCIEDQIMDLPKQELPEADVRLCRYVDACFEPAYDHVILGCLSHNHTF